MQELVAKPEAPYQCRLVAVRVLAVVANAAARVRQHAGRVFWEDASPSTAVLASAVKPLVSSVCQWASRDPMTGKGTGFRLKGLVGAAMNALLCLHTSVPAVAWSEQCAAASGTFWLSQLAHDCQVSAKVSRFKNNCPRRVL